MKRKKIGYWGALTDEEIKEFLETEVTCRLGMSVNDKPYIVPLAYVYHEGKIYIHWYGGRGIKVEYARKNPRVCFEVDVYSKNHLFWKSIIASGTLKKVTDVAKKREALELFCVKYPELASGVGHPRIVKFIMQKGMGVMARFAHIYEFEAEEMTGVIQDLKE
ncbi:MAG: pyridoxamine 5'-phosphate oxidase family protein [Candidatus Omnitrophica bacterium]|nr:pyridoxamine 5'-phosphate oxidase family protein [Candidatus Omnitrophota bacterium]